MRPPCDIYLTGVGGQGIGLLSRVLTLSLRSAGYLTIGTDTHGVAQRGGTVVSQIRVGPPLFGPIIPPGSAHLVIALERLEALRAAGAMLATGGTLAYCDTGYQPIAVRAGKAADSDEAAVAAAVAERRGRLIRVPTASLPDPKLQNTALLKALVSARVMDGLTGDRVLGAMASVLPAEAFAANRALFEK